MARGFEAADSVAGLTFLVAAFAVGPPSETCVRDVVFTETFGLDADNKCSVDAAFFAVTEGLSLLVATAAAVAYEQRDAAETRTRDE